MINNKPIVEEKICLQILNEKHDRKISFVRVQLNNEFNTQILPLIDAKARKQGCTREDVIREILQIKFEYTSVNSVYPAGAMMRRHMDIPLEFGLKIKIGECWVISHSYKGSSKRLTFYRILNNIICEHLGLQGLK